MGVFHERATALQTRLYQIVHPEVKPRVPEGFSELRYWSRIAQNYNVFDASVPPGWKIATVRLCAVMLNNEGVKSFRNAYGRCLTAAEPSLAQSPCGVRLWTLGIEEQNRHQ